MINEKELKIILNFFNERLIQLEDPIYSEFGYPKDYLDALIVLKTILNEDK